MVLKHSARVIALAVATVYFLSLISQSVVSARAAGATSGSQLTSLGFSQARVESGKSVNGIINNGASTVTPVYGCYQATWLSASVSAASTSWGAGTFTMNNATGSVVTQYWKFWTNGTAGSYVDSAPTSTYCSGLTRSADLSAAVDVYPTGTLTPSSQTINAVRGTAITASSSLIPNASWPDTLVYSVSPSLPAGLNFDTSSGVITGTATTAQASTNYTVTAKTTSAGVVTWDATATISIAVTGLAASFDTHGGSPVSDLSFTTNSNLTLPLAPTRAGYTFDGWFTSGTGGSLLASPRTMTETNDVTYHAQWTANSNAVSFDTHGGSAEANSSFNTGSSLTLPPNPSRAGYSFTGWYENATGGTALTSPYSPAATSDITLHAQWSANSNVVLFDTHGGSAVSSSTFLTGGQLSLPAISTRNGYTSTGWFLSATGGSALANPYSPTATSGFTLHSQWAANQNTVIFNTHGGSTVSDGLFYTGGTMTLPSAPTRAGYTFDGWFGNASGGTALTSPYSPSATTDIILHAQWTIAPTNGGTGSGSSGTSTSTNSTIEIQSPIGSSVRGSSVAVNATGLAQTAAYSLVMRSTPITIATGNAVGGAASFTATIPSGVEAGWHTVTFTSVDNSGAEYTSVLYFRVSTSGVLLETRLTDPAQSLANTGITGAPVLPAMAWLLVLSGLALVLHRRNRY